MSAPTEIPGEIRVALRDTLTEKGLRQWWTAKNQWLDGYPPAECWKTPGNRPRVVGVAWALAEGVYV